MTDESQFRPHLENVRPAQGTSDITGSLIRLDVVDEDFCDLLHFGALQADSLALDIDPGTARFDAIIKDGEIQSDSSGRRFSALVVPRITLTGSRLTGTTLTGRFGQRTAIWYLPREFFADGQRIGVRVSATDKYGYELDQTHYFTMHAWRPFVWPQFSLWTEDQAGPLNVIPFLWYPRGTTAEVSLELFWGLGSSLDLDLDDAALGVLFCGAAGQGKEIIENGYCTFKKAGEEDWQPLSADTAIQIGTFKTNVGKDIRLRLAIPEGASTEGLIVLTLSLTAIRASLTGTRLCGSELTGGSTGHLIPAHGHDPGFYLCTSVMSPRTRDYFENHFVGPLAE
ncbi:MAG: hypothetical protein JW759_08975 [Candidatus Coatesbacteria bacterium]|nr:hypothetical protein [Candidatus Coatesbacteria bacterium]